MTERPVLDRNLNSKIFRDFYYLKEELVDFCRKNLQGCDCGLLSNYRR